MSDPGDDNPDEETPGAHGVHGTTRDDGRMQEEPEQPEGADVDAWAEKTETGGEAS